MFMVSLSMAHVAQCTLVGKDSIFASVTSPLKAMMRSVDLTLLPCNLAMKLASNLKQGIAKHSRRT